MSELKDLILKLKMEKMNGTEGDKTKASRDHAKDDYLPTFGGDLAGSTGLRGVFGHAGTRPTFC